jgi:ankyrin repeat protein
MLESASRDTQNEDGVTPLHYADASSTKPEIFAAILASSKQTCRTDNDAGGRGAFRGGIVRPDLLTKA